MPIDEPGLSARLIPLRQPVWTDERIAQLSDLVAKGFSSGAIAQVMHVTRNAIIGKRNRLGLRHVGTRVHATMARPQRQNGGRPRLVARRSVAARTPVKPAEVGTSNISFIDLQEHHCRYPIDADGPTTYCGRSKFGHFSYCEAHFRLTHNFG